MPRVPTYDTQPLQPTIRQGQARAPLGVDEAAMPGRQIQQAGETMGRVGSALSQYVLQQQELFNRARVASISNEIDAFAMQAADEYGALRGEAAIRPGENQQDPIASRISSFDRFVSERATNLPSAVQSDVDQYVSRVRTRLEGGLRSHFAREGRTYASEANKARIDIQTQNLIRDPASPETPDYFARIGQAVRDQGAADGLPADAIAMNVKNTTSAAVATVLDGMIENNRVGDAERFLEQYGSLMTDEARSTAQARVREAGSVARGESMAQAVLSQLPVTRNDTRGPARERALRAAATDENGNFDRQAFEHSRTFMNRSVSLREEQIRNAEAQSYENLVRLSQRDPAAALNSTAFFNLSPSDQERFTNGLINGAPPTAAQNREWFELRGDPGYEDRIAAMTQGQIQAMRPSLGESRYNELLADYRSVVQPQADLNDVRMTGDNATILRSALNRLGISTNSEEFVQAQERARDLVQIEQRRLGKPLDNIEMENFLLQEMGREISRGGGLFASRTRPLVEFSYRDIPAVDRNRIEAALESAYERAVAAGYNRSEQFNPAIQENIVRQYIAEQRGEDIIRAP